MAFRLSARRGLSWMAGFSARQGGNSGNKVIARFTNSQGATSNRNVRKCSSAAAVSFGVALFGLGGKKEDEVEDQNKILENIKLGIMAQRVRSSSQTKTLSLCLPNLLFSSLQRMGIWTRPRVCFTSPYNRPKCSTPSTESHSSTTPSQTWPLSG